MCQASEDQEGDLAPFFPAEGADLDVTDWVEQLARAGLPLAPEHFMRASGAAALGLAPDQGSQLEAEMMVEHVAAMVSDFRARGALP